MVSCFVDAEIVDFCISDTHSHAVKGACLFKISKGYCMAATENGVDLSRLIRPNLHRSVLFKKQGTVLAVCDTMAFM